jgi:hypothetical protein
MKKTIILTLLAILIIVLGPEFLYGEDHNLRQLGVLQGLNKPGIEVKVYDGSGHALEDPPGLGNRLFREEALVDIRDFILSINP